MAKKPGSLFVPLLMAGCLLGAAVQWAVLWSTDWPLGVAGEWTWPRTMMTRDDWLAAMPAWIVGAVLLSFACCAAPRGPRGTWRQSVLIWTLPILGTAWLLSLAASQPGAGGIGRIPFVQYYTRSTGYFWQARYDVTSLREFLSTYETRIQDETNPDNHLHLGTHPPGLTTGFVGLRTLFERSEPLTRAAVASQPFAVREAMALIVTNERANGRTLTDVDVATLWMSSVLTAFLAALASVPLCFVARRSFSDFAAWIMAFLWLMVPSLAIFLPVSDLLFPAIALFAQWVWLSSRDRSSWMLGGLTGAIMWGAMWLTLAFLPIGLMLALQMLLPKRMLAKAPGNRWKPIVGGAVAFVGLTAIVWGALEINLPAIWLQNVRNHASFYDHHQRTYWPWLRLAPWELAFSLGAPIACCGLVGLMMLIGGRRSGRFDLLIPCVVWLVLLFTGKNMGEMARLWIIFMPYALLTAGGALERLQERRWGTVGLLTLQLAVCVFTVFRVDGFHFVEFLL